MLQRQADAMNFVEIVWETFTNKIHGKLLLMPGKVLLKSPNRINPTIEKLRVTPTITGFLNAWEIATNVWQIVTTVWEIATYVGEIATNVWETQCPGKIVSVNKI